MERVFITGVGAVSCVGASKTELWESLVAGRCGLSQLTVHDTKDLPVTIGGEIREIDERLASANGRLNTKRMDRATQFAVWAATQAITDSGLTPSELGPRCGVIIGAGLSGMATLQTQTENLVSKGARRVSPFTIPMLMPNAAPANVGMAFDITGPCYTTSSACSSSAHAIANAFDLLRTSQMDAVISGGTESSMTRLGIASFCKMGAMSDAYNDRPTEAIRPFEANRKGLIMSEGAGLVVLETESSMQKRGAEPYAELIGYGSTSDSHHIVAPDPTATGAALAISQAIDSTGQSIGDLASRSYINAHGTATELNDVTETLAIRKAFGEHADQVQISSTKSMTGHLIGASGGVELIASALALRDRVLPPTINYEVPDPRCDLDYIPNTARPSDIDYAFSNSFGFGGHNVCLALRRA